MSYEDYPTVLAVFEADCDEDDDYYDGPDEDELFELYRERRTYDDAL